ncbi:hypothetical protein DERP_008153, partial [Dermatophagoides pteronyssinus]
MNESHSFILLVDSGLMIYDCHYDHERLLCYNVWVLMTILTAGLTNLIKTVLRFFSYYKSDILLDHIAMWKTENYSQFNRV